MLRKCVPLCLLMNVRFRKNRSSAHSEEGKRLLAWADGEFNPAQFDRRAANAAIQRLLWNAYSTGFCHPVHRYSATGSTMILPGQSERSEARFSG